MNFRSRFDHLSDASRLLYACQSPVAPCHAALRHSRGVQRPVVSIREWRRADATFSPPHFRTMTNDRRRLRNAAVSYGLQSRRPPNIERDGRVRNVAQRHAGRGATSGDNASGLRVIGSRKARTVRSVRAVEQVRQRDRCEWSGGSVAVVILAVQANKLAAKLRSGDHEYYR